MPADSLDALLEEELRDLYDAEKQLTKALPKLVKKASGEELKEALSEHLEQTEQHVERLEQAFEHLGRPARGKPCEGMKHLISEGNEMIAEAGADATRDAVMIAAAQKVEHYEIAGYGTARTWATVLGKTDVAALLEEILEEEKQADQKLTEIAESHVNQAAAGGKEASALRGRKVRSARAGYMRGARERAADRNKKKGR
jgi:ferritin-like metal-binding protein YciE